MSCLLRVLARVRAVLAVFHLIAPEADVVADEASALDLLDAVVARLVQVVEGFAELTQELRLLRRPLRGGRAVHGGRRLLVLDFLVPLDRIGSLRLGAGVPRLEWFPGVVGILGLGLPDDGELPAYRDDR